MINTRSSFSGFNHQALFYRGLDDFISATTEFIQDGLAAGEPIMVAVSADKIDRLRNVLGRNAGAVHFADMAEIGDNPARIIPAWSDFAGSQAGGRALRGIGEPIWRERSATELVECQRHEALLNLAFEEASAFWLLCPYDLDALEPSIIEEAERSHPVVRADRDDRPSRRFVAGTSSHAHLDAPLLEPAGSPARLDFDLARLGSVRAHASRAAARAGMPPRAVADFVVAVSEAASNSVLHGGGRGSLRIWEDADAHVAEVADAGRIDDPLAGRRRPGPGSAGSRGLWVANQICDLVQLRVFDRGSVVRLHLRP